MSDADQDQKKKPTHRSPAYPALTLQRAVEYAETIYKHDKRTAVPVAVVAGHFKTDIKSSKGLRLISALKQFGLVVEEGSGDDRSVRLSDRALDIVLSDSPKASERISAIREAALAPPIHKKVWEEYSGDLPSDPVIKRYLLRTLNFNDAYVDGFIKKFRTTLAFAQITGSDIIEEEPEENGEEVGDMDEERDRNPRVKAPQPGAGVRDFPLYTSGPKGVLYVPEKLSRADFELLKKQIEHSLDIIEATAVQAQ